MSMRKELEQFQYLQRGQQGRQMEPHVQCTVYKVQWCTVHSAQHLHMRELAPSKKESKATGQLRINLESTCQNSCHSVQRHHVVQSPCEYTCCPNTCSTMCYRYQSEVHVPGVQAQVQCIGAQMHRCTGTVYQQVNLQVQCAVQMCKGSVECTVQCTHLHRGRGRLWLGWPGGHNRTDRR